ncbi:MAG TPA: YcxB family protein [Prevotella sp.]
METEVVFECRWRMEDEPVKELIEKVSRRRVLIVTGILMLLLGIYSYEDLARGNYYTAIPYFFFVCLALFFSIGRLKRGVKQYRKHVKAIYGTDDIETVIRFGERIEIAEQENVSVYQYSQIIRVYALKHTYALMLSKRIGILVPYNSFVQGRREDFETFLLERCKQLKKIG